MEPRQTLPAAPQATPEPIAAFVPREMSDNLARIFRVPQTPRNYLRIEAGIYPEQELPTREQLANPQWIEPQTPPTPREPGIRAGAVVRWRFTSPNF